eukprot:TRINITY_DN27649_c0_g1_i1.p1 TRINITY_DN27649_c0_g1~~TRINITY_DN27649_c0_g1_i1.p1  ORF type:complete len:1203 (+),score=260.07 TRINITY_DN27649_c0_g1_i1:107-3715(+)
MSARAPGKGAKSPKGPQTDAEEDVVGLDLEQQEEAAEEAAQKEREKRLLRCVKFLQRRCCRKGGAAYRCCNRVLRAVKFSMRVIVVVCKFIGWILIQFFCRARLRQAALARNAWVKFRDRAERLDELKTRGQEYNQQLVRIMTSKGYSRRVILYRTFTKQASDLMQYIRDGFWQLMGGRNRENGLPNDLLEKWRLLSVVGQGPHGVVFKACNNIEGDVDYIERNVRRSSMVAIRIRDKSQGQLVRLKLGKASRLLRRNVLQSGPVMRQVNKVLACLRIVTKTVEHECIAKILDVRDTGEYYIEVLEYMAGGSLYHYLEFKEILDEFTVCRIATRICRALEYLHSRNLIHRDVRLQQVVLVDQGNPESCKLADLWGLTYVHKKKKLVIEEGRPCDLATAAPEVLMYGEYSEKSDVWATGCAIFELLHGHPPFVGRGEALIQRICLQAPSFSKLGTGKEGVSESAIQLLNDMLNRNVHARPDMAQVLKHKWFQEFGGKKPGRKIWQTERLIRRTVLYGKPPISRRGLPASNLLHSKAGQVTAGFCTFMGSTSVDIDFEVRGKSEHQDYWVTQCRLALWGREENPRHVILKACVRPGAPWAEVGSVDVNDAGDTEARIIIDKPIRFVRLSMRGNLGGGYGIAIRKVCFYGYEVRQVPIMLNLQTSKYLRGSNLHTHAEDIVPKDLDGRVHRSLEKHLRAGKRMEIGGGRYKVYEDVSSGAPHITTAVQTTRLKLPKDVVLKGAVFGLRYISEVPSKEAAAPKIRLQIIREVESTAATKPAKGAGDKKEYEKIVLFATEELPAAEWDASGILSKGYVDYPMMFANHLDFDTGQKLCLEVLFENYAGTLHVPPDLGLSFYYVPELGTPSSDDEATGGGENMGDKMKTARRAGGLLDAGSSGALDGGLAKKDTTKVTGGLLDHGSEAGESEREEVELQAELSNQQQDVQFGMGGLAQEQHVEVDPYFPEELSSKPKGLPWWKDLDEDGVEDEDDVSRYSAGDSVIEEEVVAAKPETIPEDPCPTCGKIYAPDDKVCHGCGEKRVFTAQAKAYEEELEADELAEERLEEMKEMAAAIDDGLDVEEAEEAFEEQEKIEAAGELDPEAVHQAAVEKATEAAKALRMEAEATAHDRAEVRRLRRLQREEEKKGFHDVDGDGDVDATDALREAGEYLGSFFQVTAPLTTCTVEMAKGTSTVCGDVTQGDKSRV